MGGAYLSNVPDGDCEIPAFLGSIVLAQARTKKEVLDALKADVYSEGEVWDWEKVQIYPVRRISAIRSRN